MNEKEYDDSSGFAVIAVKVISAMFADDEFSSFRPANKTQREENWRMRFIRQKEESVTPHHLLPFSLSNARTSCHAALHTHFIYGKLYFIVLCLNWTTRSLLTMSRIHLLKQAVIYCTCSKEQNSWDRWTTTITSK